MFSWLKERWILVKEINRLSKESRRLKEELERQTGEPVNLTEKELAELRQAANGLDQKTLERISVFGSEITASSETRKPTSISTDD